jgi:2-oxo-4-hydroxy-4-carboxy-5-ureidoimidazoline decarboxylase
MHETAEIQPQIHQRTKPVNPVLAAWNASEQTTALAALLSCCSASRWATQIIAMRPFSSETDFYNAADQVWATMQEPDWMQAFSAHPRIGERKAPAASAQSSEWSSHEQAAVQLAQSKVLDELATGNALYETRFGFTYIVCATGKSAEEMLTILQRRLANDRRQELHEAAEQQRQITQLRLRKWLQS